MCLTLPRVLITMVGIEKVIPTLGDLEVFLQLLARSATGERMNPYNTIWTGVTPGDGPEEFHVILLDNGRTKVLADEVSRSTLQCIRCGACLNQCPVIVRPAATPTVDLQRSDRRDPDTAAPESRTLAVAAVCVIAVRRVLRGVSGQDQHSGNSDPSETASG
jgi:ferredoxin